MRQISFKGMIGVVVLLAGSTLSGIDPDDTRLLAQPAISENHIAFIYAHDLWVADADGSNPRRLTVDEGNESGTCFSPDGKLIAFSAEYDGNTDVFTIPVEGGIPTRLTWHPGSDYTRGFTPDGKSVLFLSQRSTFTGGLVQLFTVPLEGGYPRQLEIPNAYHACYSPDGKYMVYSPHIDAFRQWKNYRGGRISTLWIFSFEDHSVTEIPKPQGGCNDVDPMWIGDVIYFLSDRNGEFNLFACDVPSKEVTQLTAFNDFPIINASHHGRKIIFERTGYLYRFDLSDNSTEKITVGVAADLLELRSRYVKGGNYIRSAHISPSGVRAVFGFRGEIITVPAEKGDPRNISQTTGAHEKYPAWSPDGKHVACFSDASGENMLHIRSQDGKGEARSISLTGTGFYSDLQWSPDSKKICYTDNGRNFYLLDVESGSISKIDTDEIYFPGPFRSFFGDWSSDSKWIVYSRVNRTNFHQVFLYSVDNQESYPVSDGMSDADEPVFDPGGKYLYFFGSTDAGPVLNWFDLSSMDMEMTRNIYLVTLSGETTSPFKKESDEVETGEEDEEDEGEEEEKGREGKKKKEMKGEDEEKEEILEIDLEGLQNRIVDVPLEAGDYHGLGCAKEDELLFIVNRDGERMLHKYDIKEQKDEEVAEMDSYILSADGKKMLYRKDRAWGIADAGAKPDPEKGMLNTGNIEVKIDPVAEWPQIFDEAWRINRDYFYDPGMHGADWPAMKQKYAQFLPHLACRSDLNRVIQWMCSELAVGHHRVGGGETLDEPERVGGGLLGADYAIENNRYRIRKVFEGLNWNPDLRSPLTEPGLNVETGDYILAVNGEELTAGENIFKFFENKAGKIVELTIGPDPGGGGSREIQVVPVADESALRNRDWVEGNLKKVHEATNGQVAYVYVPNTSTAGHEYFKRYFFPQSDKKAIIVDERFNGGGSLADYYIDILSRRYQSYWNTRYTHDFKTPTASIQGPRVMLINELAGSGGDMLPWMFRKFGLGKLVGKRTWGGLVGMLGFPGLMDGGYVTAPNLAIWTEDGFVVENVGVPPDIEVEQTPSLVIEGHDPQLEKAIEVVMEALEENPPREPERPPYPDRALN